MGLEMVVLAPSPPSGSCRPSGEGSQLWGCVLLPWGESLPPPHRPWENYMGGVHPCQPLAPTSFSGFRDHTLEFWDYPLGLRWQHQQSAPHGARPCTCSVLCPHP